MKLLRPQARFGAQPPAGRLLARRSSFEEAARLAGTERAWESFGRGGGQVAFAQQMTGEGRDLLTAFIRRFSRRAGRDTGSFPGNAPPIFFSSCRKENGPCTVQKKRRRVPNLALTAQGLAGRGSCESVCPGSEAPSSLRRTSAVEGRRPRIRWCGGRHGCKGESAYFYSRAFRFATRCRGSCGSRQRLRLPGARRVPWWRADMESALTADQESWHRPPGQRLAAAQPLAALLPYGCGVPLAGKA